MVGEEASTPITPAVSITFGICLLVVFLQDSFPNNLGFRHNLEVSALFLRVPLRCFVSDVSVGGSKVFSELFDHFRGMWIVLSD